MKSLRAASFKALEGNDIVYSFRVGERFFDVRG